MVIFYNFKNELSRHKVGKRPDMNLLCSGFALSGSSLVCFIVQQWYFVPTKLPNALLFYNHFKYFIAKFIVKCTHLFLINTKCTKAILGFSK